MSDPLPLSWFDYELPPELIAQEPLPERTQARLLVVSRTSQSFSHRRIADLPAVLRAGDLLVFNDTRVLPARLLGNRERTGGKWEGLYLSTEPDGTWRLLCQTGGRPGPGETFLVHPLDGDRDPLRLSLVERAENGTWLMRPERNGTALELLTQYGRVPLPPYIRKGRERPEDRDRYQTVYAARPGAVAAPTAGLHFTRKLLDELDAAGVSTAFVTLHVGAGTFQPIQSADVRGHPMHSEWGELSAATVSAVEASRRRGGRVVAVGTTTVRVLETAASFGAEMGAWSGETQLFIHPPYQFRAVDALLTNFHLPRSSLLVLLSAFAGLPLTQEAYRIAVSERYRFYSYGDAMLVE